MRQTPLLRRGCEQTKWKGENHGETSDGSYICSRGGTTKDTIADRRMSSGDHADVSKHYSLVA